MTPAPDSCRYAETGGKELCAATAPSEEFARRYRPRRYFLYVGIVCTAFFLVLGVGSASLAWWNADGSFRHPRLTALIFAVFWSPFILLGVWLSLYAARRRLVFTTTSVESTGAIRRKRLAFDEVTRVKWRRFPGQGSIVLRTTGRRLAIDLGDFSPGERQEIIELTRRLFDEQLQEGWPRFYDCFIERSVAQQKHGRRWCLSTAAGLCACGAFFAYAWRAGRGDPYLTLALANFALALYYLVRAAMVRKAASPEETPGTGRE